MLFFTLSIAKVFRDVGHSHQEYGQAYHPHGLDPPVEKPGEHNGEKHPQNNPHDDDTNIFQWFQTLTFTQQNDVCLYFWYFIHFHN